MGNSRTSMILNDLRMPEVPAQIQIKARLEFTDTHDFDKDSDIETRQFLDNEP